MAREKSNKVNIYKIANIFDFDTVDFDDLDGFVKEFEDATRKLFIRRLKPGTPNWLTYLKPLISSNVDQIKNYNSSFILIIKHNVNIYALSGGHAYSKLEKYIEADFGVRMALKMIKEKGILALNQRSLKGSTRQIYRAVIGYDPIFDKDNFTRVLNSLEGTGEFEGRTFRIIGKSALALRTTKDIARLSEVLAEIEAIANQSEKIHFPKSFIVEKEETIVNELNDEMLKMVSAYWRGNSDRDRLYLEFKDAFTQFRCSRFEARFKSTKIEFDDFDLDIIKNLYIDNGIKDVASLDDLKKIMLVGFNEDGFEEFKGKFKDLLVCEIIKDGKSYIKIGNQWLQILDEIQKFINDQLRMIQVLKNFLPEWNKQQYPLEIDYNNFVAEQKQWKCMDQQCIVMERPSKIELCDIFDKTEKRFFHIKETWGSKSAYLFTQGSTAAEFFYNSVNFRQKCLEKWPDQFNGDYFDYKVVFGIVSNKSSDDEFPLNMTFFAKLNLYNAISILSQIGYKSFLAPIKVIN